MAAIKEQLIDFRHNTSDESSQASPTSDLVKLGNPSQSAFEKQVSHSIAPFLTRHIPEQYAPLGEHKTVSHSHTGESNTRFCYRHRPDLKCRRQADEPSMDQLQNELATLPQSDQEGISHVWSLFSAAPSKHRHLMLQGILAQCCFPQLSFISASVRDLIKIDFLTALPSEIGLRILCYLDPTSICKAAQVSERWRSLADDDVVWHRMCEQHIDRKCTKCGWGLPLLDQQRLRTEKRQIQLRKTSERLTAQQSDRSRAALNESTSDFSQFEHANQYCAGPDSASRKRSHEVPFLSPSRTQKRIRQSPSEHPKKSNHLPQRKPWKDVYRDRFRIGTNWKYFRCSVKNFRGHANGIMCLQFDDNIIASGSYDTTIKIWDIETGEEVRTLRGHSLGIRCLQFDNTKLASGSLDGTVKLWDLETGKELCTLRGHTAGVIGLHLDGTTVASGSADHTIRVWDFKDHSAIVLRGHTDWVNAVKIDMSSRTLLSASDDCTVRLWDLDTKRCIQKFEGHHGQVQQVLTLPPEFELAERDEMEPVESRFTYDGSEDYDNSERPAPPRYMLTGGLDSTIRMWDIHQGTCIKTFFGHLEGIWALAADTLRIVSGANDGMVKIWDPRSSKCERTIAGHAGPVTCVGLNDRRMCTGSEDHEVRLYSFCA